MFAFFAKFCNALEVMSVRSVQGIKDVNFQADTSYIVKHLRGEDHILQFLFVDSSLGSPSGDNGLVEDLFVPVWFVGYVVDELKHPTFAHCDT